MGGQSRPVKEIKPVHLAGMIQQRQTIVKPQTLDSWAKLEKLWSLLAFLSFSFPSPVEMQICFQDPKVALPRMFF